MTDINKAISAIEQAALNIEAEVKKMERWSKADEARAAFDEKAKLALGELEKFMAWQPTLLVTDSEMADKDFMLKLSLVLGRSGFEMELSHDGVSH